MIKKVISCILSFVILSSMVTGAPFAIAATENFPSLRVHYTFDGAQKNATDSSSNNRNGSIYGTTELSNNAVFGQSLLLKGGYVHMPTDILLQKTSFSISVWACPLDKRTWSRIWDIGNSTDQYIALMSPTNEDKFACEIKNGSNTSRATSSKSFTYNKWINFVLNYTEGGNIEVYENGVKVSEATTKSIKISDFKNIANAYIGRSMFNADSDFYGFVDDFRIYESSLTQTQISDEYAEGVKSLTDSTVAELDIAVKNNLTRLDGVQQNLSLPDSSDINNSDCNIEWSTDNADVITDKGVLGSTLGTAKLTAKLTRDGYSKETSFDITTVEQDITADPIESITVTPGTAPSLPKNITANNGAVSLSVTWVEPTPAQYAFKSSFTANGTASNNQAVSVNINVSDSKIANLLIPNAAPDPYVTYHDGYYYYVKSDGQISVAKSKRLQEIGSAPRIVVFTPPSSGMYSRNYWAPEIHFIDGDWYIYVAADNGDNANHRMYCLKSTDPTNAQAQYEMMGKLAPTSFDVASKTWKVKSSEDKWAIDGTVLQNTDGKNYFIWSGWAGNSDGRQDLYIAEMLNPYTLKGSRTMISKPDQKWELKGTGTPYINEGPQVVVKNNKITVIYSCNGSWTDWYSTGAVYADVSSDLLNAANWTKSSGPLFTQSLDPTEHSYSTGHACITSSPDGNEDYFIYHAFHAANGGWEDRSARIVKVNWMNDMPILGNPVSESGYIDSPSGTDTDMITAKYEAETAEIVNANISANEYQSGGKYVTGLGTNSSLTFNVNAPIAGKYLISFMGNCLSATSGNSSQDVEINGTTYKIKYRINGGDHGYKRVTPSYLASASNKDELYATLQQGENKIKVTRSADAGGNADIDYLSLVFAGDMATEVVLNKKTATIFDGETTTLSAITTPSTIPDTKIIWASADTSIATVNNGIVTAKKPGTVVIYASAHSNPFIKDTCTVTVNQVDVTKVELNKTQESILLGNNTTLSVTITPENASYKNVVWTTDNDKIVTVDDSGKVTAVGVGQSTITATSFSNNDKKASCVITVNPIDLTQITLNKTSDSIYIGSTSTLIATFTPDNATYKDVNWTSSNNSIATVQNGTVKAISLGTVVITATSVNYPNIKLTCTVTVKPIPVTSVTLKKKSAALTVGGKTTIISTVYPKNATYRTITYKSNDTAVASVNSSGIVTAKKPGVAKIKVSSGGKTATFTVTVNPAKPTSFKLKKSGKKVTVLYKRGAGASKIKITVVKGKTVKSYYSTGKSSYKLTLKKGVYKIKICSYKKVSNKVYLSLYTSYKTVTIK